MGSQGTGRSEGKSRRLWWLAAMGGGLVAVRFYYVREMIAALVIFSALFVIGAAIVLAVFVLDLLTKTTFTWAESGVERLARWAANTSGAIFRQTGLSLQRLRLGTVRSNWLSRHS
jgi:hypothetical protein